MYAPLATRRLTCDTKRVQRAQIARRRARHPSVPRAGTIPGGPRLGLNDVGSQCRQSPRKRAKRQTGRHPKIEWSHPHGKTECTSATIQVSNKDRTEGNRESRGKPKGANKRDERHGIRRHGVGKGAPTPHPPPPTHIQVTLPHLQPHRRSG